MNEFNTNYDCVVMGGGPAGSTAATLIAQAGFSTLLVERESMPRPHVGESLMPETYWIFERLGLLDQMQKSDYPKKVGVQFVNNTGKESSPFFFRSHDDRPSSETWHVDRAQFDKMLFDNAAAKGATCRDNTRVLNVLFDNNSKTENQRATGVLLQQAANAPVEVTSKIVVDATGQQTLLANRLGLRPRKPRPSQSGPLAVLPQRPPRRVRRRRQNGHPTHRRQPFLVLVHPPCQRPRQRRRRRRPRRLAQKPRHPHSGFCRRTEKMFDAPKLARRRPSRSRAASRPRIFLLDQSLRRRRLGPDRRRLGIHRPRLLLRRLLRTQVGHPRRRLHHRRPTHRRHFRSNPRPLASRVLPTNQPHPQTGQRLLLRPVSASANSSKNTPNTKAN